MSNVNIHMSGSALTAEYLISPSTGIIHQKVDATVVVDNETYPVTSLEVNTNRYAETGRVDATVVADQAPRKKGEIEVMINGLDVFTGFIDQTKDKGNGAFEIVAFDEIKKFIRTNVNKNYEKVTLSYLARSVAQEAGTFAVTDLPDDTKVSPDYNGISVVSALNQIAKWGDALWWVDEAGVLYVGQPEPTRFNIEPEFLEPDPTAGKKEPPYQKVIVHGEAPASRSQKGIWPGGADAYHMITSNPVTSTAGSGEPVYKYSSKQIRSQRQADRVAEAILREFQRQRAQGEIVVIGEGAPIRPLDVVEMPEELGSEQYLVSGVKHTFDSREGFVTEVNCGGLIEPSVESELSGSSPYEDRGPSPYQ